MAGCAQPAPAGQVLPAQVFFVPPHELEVEVLVEGTGAGRHANVSAHQELEQLNAARLVAVTAHHEGVAPWCGAVDLHRVGRHAPAAGARQLDALRHARAPSALLRAPDSAPPSWPG